MLPAQRIIYLITLSLRLFVSLFLSLPPTRRILNFPPREYFMRELITCYTLRRVENASF